MRNFGFQELYVGLNFLRVDGTGNHCFDSWMAQNKLKCCFDQAYAMIITDDLNTANLLQNMLWVTARTGR